LPRDMGGIDSLGFLLLRPADEGGHANGLHGLDIVWWLGWEGCR
jgi:hypothetical protein